MNRVMLWVKLQEFWGRMRKDFSSKGIQDRVLVERWVGVGLVIARVDG